MPGRGEDLVELFERIQAEGAAAVREIRFRNRFRRFHRMHEAQRGIRQQARDETHLGDRGDVVMRDAAVPQDPQQIGRRIRLHGIPRTPRKPLDEEARGARRGVRADQRDRLDRP